MSGLSLSCHNAGPCILWFRLGYSTGPFVDFSHFRNRNLGHTGLVFVPGTGFSILGGRDLGLRFRVLVFQVRFEG